MPTLTFKVTPREAARIREEARRERVTLSEFLRRRAMAPAAAAPAASGYRIIESPLTGLPVMHPPEGSTPVTSAQIRALLSDFP